jgi:hypothetical protein
MTDEDLNKIYDELMKYKTNKGEISEKLSDIIDKYDGDNKYVMIELDILREVYSRLRRSLEKKEVEKELKFIVDNIDTEFRLSFLKRLVDVLNYGIVDNDMISNIFIASEAIFGNDFEDIFDLRLKYIDLRELDLDFLESYVDSDYFEVLYGDPLYSDDATMEEVLEYLLYNKTDEYYKFVGIISNEDGCIERIANYFNNLIEKVESGEKVKGVENDTEC